MITSVDIVSFETTAQLRKATDEYWSALRGFPEMLPQAHKFARSYLWLPDGDLSSRITPIMRSELIDGETTDPIPKGLAVAVDDERRRPRLNVQIELGHGAMPAVIEAPQIYQLEERANGLKTCGFGEMERALTECEGRGLLLNVYAATKHAIEKRTRFARILDVAKTKVLG